MSKKLVMPRNRKRFDECIINTFIAGCQFGYAVMHTHKMQEQEMLGALAWLGEITTEEANEKLLEIWGETA